VDRSSERQGVMAGGMVKEKVASPGDDWGKGETEGGEREKISTRKKKKAVKSSDEHR
jgi:hypothetical protein